MSNTKKIRYVEGPTRVTVGNSTFKLSMEKVVDAEFGERLLKIDFLKFEEVKDVSKKKKVVKKVIVSDEEDILE